jgi:hypothetical protein
MLDWRGVEAGLPEGSFKRKLVEGWIRAGTALFGEWEWPWEGGGGLSEVGVCVNGR